MIKLINFNNLIGQTVASIINIEPINDVYILPCRKNAYIGVLQYEAQFDKNINKLVETIDSLDIKYVIKNTDVFNKDGEIPIYIILSENEQIKLEKKIINIDIHQLYHNHLLKQNLIIYNIRDEMHTILHTLTEKDFNQGKQQIINLIISQIDTLTVEQPYIQLNLGDNYWFND